MGKNESKQLKKNIKAKTVCIVIVVIILLCVALAASIFFYSRFEKAKSQELPDGYVTYNASRYFFRFDRPSEWLVTNDSNGFLLDDELGKVCKLNPCILSEENEDSVLYDSVEINFFYREIENYNSVDISYNEIASEFKDLISSGKIFSDISENVTFGNQDIASVENIHNELCSVDFSANTEEGEIRGTMYLAKRKKAYYCVLVSYENEADYNLFKDDIMSVIESFRMTVLED